MGKHINEKGADAYAIAISAAGVFGRGFIAC
jgi:hypothetical protein